MPPSFKTQKFYLLGTRASTAAPPLVTTLTMFSTDLVFLMGSFLLLSTLLLAGVSLLPDFLTGYGEGDFAFLFFGGSLATLSFGFEFLVVFLGGEGDLTAFFVEVVTVTFLVIFLKTTSGFFLDGALGFDLDLA